MKPKARAPSGQTAPRGSHEKQAAAPAQRPPRGKRAAGDATDGAGVGAAPAALTVPDALAGLPQPTGTRERILFAAVTVLFDEGFTSLTQQRVCERAGIRQSHLTYYFPTRNDLLREAAAFGCEAMFKQIARGIDQGEVTVANLRATLNADLSDRRWARLMNALIAASDEDVRIKPWLAAFDEQIAERLLHDMQRLGLKVTRAEVDVLHATFVGAIQMDLAASTPASLARARRVIGQALDRLVEQGKARAAGGSLQRRARNKSATDVVSLPESELAAPHPPGAISASTARPRARKANSVGSAAARRNKNSSLSPPEK